MSKSYRIGIIGLGYVGLPLAVEFAKKYEVVGFDINSHRVKSLSNGIDATREVEENDLNAVLIDSLNDFKDNKGLFLTDTIEDIEQCNVYIVTVPTPIDDSKKPDLTPLRSASKMIGTILKQGDIVIYESTTYPGCTEEVCVPILEKESGLTYNKDFFVGYSPERINPGDKVNTLTKIKKVTSGSTPEIAQEVDDLYASIIEAGTYKASSLKVAEASKAIENAQRDVNISFVNELAIIFERLEIDTNDVLEAAGTKWNFLPYRPGLVGGHCIGVDPYYLAFKAEQTGYLPNVILSGRRVNDQMGSFIANKVVKMMIQNGIPVKNSKVLLLGMTFKENCPDIRNTRVVDIYYELQEFGCDVEVYDPWANPEEVKEEYNIDILNNPESLSYRYFDAVILAVAHQEFQNLNIQELKSENGIIYDCKGVLERSLVNARL